MHEPDSTAAPDEGSSERLVPIRLQRFLARAGIASRRGSEDLMTAGRVRVNGIVTRELGTRVDPLTDVVEVDGIVVRPEGQSAYVMLNKPAGYVTTMSDPQGRPTVAELVPREPAGLFPVGRLDRDTTGLLLFTSDGEIAHRLLHPRFHVEKAYRVTLHDVPGPDELSRLAGGVELEDGLTSPARVRVLDPGPPATLEIVIREGRKRQVRRMFAAVGCPVRALHRASFGPLELGGLAPGSWRHLDSDEVRALRLAAGQED